MKKAPPLMALLILLFTTQAFAWEMATVTIKDVGFTGKFEYAVDIYAISDAGGDAFELGTTKLTISYNATVLSSPSLSGQYADFDGSSDYGTMQLAAVATGQTQLQITPTGATGTLLPSTEIRLARITFAIDETAYLDQTAGIAWVSTLSGLTFIHNIDGGDTFLSTESETLAGNSDLVCRPAISDTPDTTALVGQWYSFTPTAVDVCAAGDLTFSISNKPDWAEFDTTTGELSGTPAFSDAGTYADIEIAVADSYGDATSLSVFDMDVTCPPGPAISDAVAPATSIAVGATYSFTPTVDDGCGALTFTIFNQPAWADFDTATGALTGQPTFSNVGTTSGIVIRVTDENGDWDEMSFDIEVTADCTAPTLSGAPLASITSGDAYSFTPTVSNGCGAITFAITNQPSWADFDAGTGALTGTPDSSDVGLYSNIVITVTDEFSGSGSLTAFDIEVTDAGSSGDDDDGSSASGSGGGGGGGGCFIATMR